MKRLLVLLVVISGIISSTSTKPKYVKSPLDEIITKYLNEQNYSVILADMDYKESEDKYYHKYRIIIEKSNPNLSAEELNDSLAVASDIEYTDTDWNVVSPIIFEEYQGDLGMTILSKKNGVLNRNSSPAGYDNYVGNSRYGRWETQSNGSSFWAFYGRYRLFSDLFYGPRYYARSDWNRYDRGYRNTSSYYGTNNSYGTKSQKNTHTSWSRKPQSFKDKVGSRVKQSSSALKSRGYTSSKSYSKTNKTSRNSSRYSKSSSRSRSGGFGK